MTDTDIIKLLFATAEKNPSLTALVNKGSSITYAELATRVKGIAINLRKQGLVEGDRVLFSIRPNIDGIVLALGIVAAGGSCVFVDLGTSSDLFSARINLAQPKYAATEGFLYALSRGPLKKMAISRGLNMPDYSTMKNVQHFYTGGTLGKFAAPTGATNIKVLLQPTHEQYVAPINTFGEAMIAFTSGTTGNPKSVRHSRQDLGAGVFAMIAASEITTESILYSDHFMFGIAGLIAGAKWIIPSVSASQQTQAYIDNLIASTATHSFLIPLDLVRVTEKVIESNIKIPSLQLIASGAAPVLPSLIAKTYKALPNTKLLAVYGMTEILPVAMTDARNKIDYPYDGDLLGKICEHVTVKIIDDEIVVSGPGLMLGYLESPEIGGNAHGEHFTGDLGKIDEQGNLVFLGRKKDMLIRGNTNIYPSLYEPAISKLPEVKDCAIIGVPDIYGDDIVVLVVEPTYSAIDIVDEASTKDISDKLRGQNLIKSLRKEVQNICSYDSIPDVIVIVNEMPLSGKSHKLDREYLRSVFLPQVRSVKSFDDAKYMTNE
jgi:long-chain acyl-CoA synthetase